MSFVMDLLKPLECYRKYYTMEKFECKCKCIWKCKYPPPKNPAWIPVKNKKCEPNQSFPLKKGLNKKDG